MASHSSFNEDEDPALQGWTLKGQKAVTRTSVNVKKFLIAKFNQGLTSGQKANPTDVAKEMQESKDSRGSPVFLLEDWETARQISSFFSRLSALNKSSRAVTVTSNDEQNLNDDDFRSWEGYSAVESLRKEVYGAVDLHHPLSCEGHNICLMAKEEMLKNVKVLELKHICVSLSLATNWESSKKKKFRKRHLRVCKFLFVQQSVGNPR